MNMKNLDTRIAELLRSRSWPIHADWIAGYLAAPKHRVLSTLDWMEDAGLVDRYYVRGDPVWSAPKITPAIKA